MRFSDVLDAMEKDPKRRFSRTGWPEVGRFIYMVPAHDVPASEWTGPKRCVQHKDVMQDDGVTITEHFVRIRGHLDERGGDGTVTVGWCPTKADLYESDWIEVI